MPHLPSPHPRTLHSRPICRVGAEVNGDDDSNAYFESCGSPGEVANIPNYGNKYYWDDFFHSNIVKQELDR